jgi:hypothetical protein
VDCGPKIMPEDIETGHLKDITVFLETRNDTRKKKLYSVS